jgi:hypothetical protein
MNAKRDLLHDLEQDYSGLTRPEFVQMMTVLDESLSAAEPLSIATPLEPLVGNIAARINSYTSADDIDDYLIILRGTIGNVLERWKLDGERPDFETVAATIENIEGDD